MNLKNLFSLTKSIFISVITTIILIFLISFIMFKTKASKETVCIFLTLINIISCFLCGLLSGFLCKSKKIIWCSLSGIIYYIILVFASLIINKGGISNAKSLISTFFICIFCSIVGGIIASYNSK